MYSLVKFTLFTTIIYNIEAHSDSRVVNFLGGWIKGSIDSILEMDDEPVTIHYVVHHPEFVLYFIEQKYVDDSLWMVSCFSVAF